MFKRNTEVLTVLDGWVKIQNLQKGQLIWDGDNPVKIVDLDVTGLYKYCRIYNYGKHILTCSQDQLFVHEDSHQCSAAQQLDASGKFQFIQEGLEKIPSLTHTNVVNSRKAKFYSLKLKNSNRYYVRVDEVTGLLVSSELLKLQD